MGAGNISHGSDQSPRPFGAWGQYTSPLEAHTAVMQQVWANYSRQQETWNEDFDGWCFPPAFDAIEGVLCYGIVGTTRCVVQRVPKEATGYASWWVYSPTYWSRGFWRFRVLGTVTERIQACSYPIT